MWPVQAVCVGSVTSSRLASWQGGAGLAYQPMAASHIASWATVVSNGLRGFGVTTIVGAEHDRHVTGGGKASVKLPQLTTCFEGTGLFGGARRLPARPLICQRFLPTSVCRIAATSCSSTARSIRSCIASQPKLQPILANMKPTIRAALAVRVLLGVAACEQHTEDGRW